MMTSDAILDMFNRYLEGQNYDRSPKSLYEPIKYVLSMGGKRIRPTLMLLAYNLYKDDPESILSTMPMLDVDVPLFISVGEPIQPSYRAILCWC